MSLLSGKVLSVETRNLGEPAVAAASIGATVLYVADASTFDETGGTLTVAGIQVGYLTTDVDENTITLAVALTVAVADQDLIEVYPPAPIKTALVSFGGDGDAVPVTVPHTLLDKFPDGTRSDETAESVTVARRGQYEYILSDAVGEPLIQASLDYVEGEVGYGLSETVAQVKDMQATGEIGADILSADTLTLAGEDLGTILSEAPGGTQLMAFRGSASEIHAGNTSGTTALRLFRLAYGDVKAGRLYRITMTGLLYGSVANDVYDLKTHFTIDGTDPTTASPQMPASVKRVSVPGAIPSSTFDKTFYWPCTADGNLQMALSLTRAAGTGSAYVFLTSDIYGFQWAVEDTGLSLSAVDPTALSQTAKADGSGSDNPPVSVKTLSWQSTHAENYVGLSSVPGSSSTADVGYSQIGWDAAYFGANQAGDRPNFSVLHFNYADIVSKLATATSIDSVQLRFKVKTRASVSGLDMSVSAHKYTSYPWIMALDHAGEIVAGRVVTGQGSRNDCAPGTTYTINLNTAVGTNLKSGLYKGLVLTTTTYSVTGLGQIFSNPSVDRPTLIITFKST